MVSRRFPQQSIDSEDFIHINGPFQALNELEGLVEKAQLSCGD